jgi:hypothetical protein
MNRVLKKTVSENGPVDIGLYSIVILDLEKNDIQQDYSIKCLLSLSYLLLFTFMVTDLQDKFGLISASS